MLETTRPQDAMAEALSLTHDRVGVTAQPDGTARLQVTDFGAPAPGGAGYGSADRVFTLTLDANGRVTR